MMSKIKDKIKNGFLTGFWNGIEPVKYRVMSYIVKSQPEKPMNWQNAFAGTRRQCVEIAYPNHTFYIDNECGDGFLKVFRGKGSPQVGHKSVFEPLDIRELPFEMWVTDFLEKGKIEDDRIVENWQKDNYPDLYKELQGLKEAIKAFKL